MQRNSAVLALCGSLILLAALPIANAQRKTVWRAATSSELEASLPARALVGNERIETEMRTASGIIDTQGHIIAGVVLITAGYSADGKYSHFMLVQSPISVSDVTLAPGSYVLGWNRADDTLVIHLYDSATGVERVNTRAHKMASGVRVEAFRIWPPTLGSILQIGRFELPYVLRDSSE